MSFKKAVQAYQIIIPRDHRHKCRFQPSLCINDAPKRNRGQRSAERMCVLLPLSTSLLVNHGAKFAQPAPRKLRGDDLRSCKRGECKMGHRLWCSGARPEVAPSQATQCDVITTLRYRVRASSISVGLRCYRGQCIFPRVRGEPLPEPRAVRRPCSHSYQPRPSPFQGGPPSGFAVMAMTVAEN